MATCCFYSFNDKFLHEIKYVQSLKVMSTKEHLVANVLIGYFRNRLAIIRLLWPQCFDFIIPRHTKGTEFTAPASVATV